MKLCFFKKKKDLKEMSKAEKKEFLSNDLIQRMIRIEQGVASSFGDPIPYKKTEYFKNLTASEKKNFGNYLKKREGKKRWFFSLFFLFMISYVFIRLEFTGNVVAEYTGMNMLLFSKVFLYVLVGFLSLIVFFMLIKE